jgi:hypothetical protein
MKTKRYSELKRLETFEDRYEYLKLGGAVGHTTFGFDRYINQTFYSSYEWKQVRDQIILRDDGCDLGVPGYEIHGNLLIHHINPMTSEAIVHGDDWILDPDFLITTSHNTHNAIHYGDNTLLKKPYVARKPEDTRLWARRRSTNGA